MLYKSLLKTVPSPPNLSKVDFFVSENRGDAMKTERYIKNMKSKIYTKNLITDTVEQSRICGLLVIRKLDC